MTEDEIVNLRIEFDAARSMSGFDSFVSAARGKLQALQSEFRDIFSGGAGGKTGTAAGGTAQRVGDTPGALPGQITNAGASTNSGAMVAAFEAYSRAAGQAQVASAGLANTVTKDLTVGFANAQSASAALANTVTKDLTGALNTGTAAAQKNVGALQNVAQGMGIIVPQGMSLSEHLADISKNSKGASQSLTGTGSAAQSVARGLSSVSSSAQSMSVSMSSASRPVLAMEDHLIGFQKAATGAGNAIATMSDQVDESLSVIDGGQREQVNNQFEMLHNLQIASFGIMQAGMQFDRFVTQPLMGISQAAQDVSLRMESAQLRLETLTGSAEIAAKQLEVLKDVATKPGIDLPTAVEAASSMQALGFSFEQATRVMLQFSNAAALSGGSVADFQGALVQLQQMANSSKVLAGDLRPIIQRMPIVGKVVKDLFGTVNSQALQKKFEKAGTGPREFIDKVLGGLESLQRAPMTGMERIANATQKVEQAMKPLGDRLIAIAVPAMEKAAEMAERLGKWFDSLPESGQNLVIGIAAVTAALGPLLIALGTLIALFSSLSLAQLAIAGTAAGQAVPGLMAVAGGMGKIAGIAEIALAGVGNLITFLTGPVGLTLIAAVAASILAYQTNFLGFADVVKQAWETVKTAFNDGLAAVQQFWNDNKAIFAQAYNNIKTALTSFIMLFKPLWDNAMGTLASTARRLWANITGIFRAAFIVLTTLVRAATQAINGDWNGALKTIQQGTQKLVVSTKSSFDKVSEYANNASRRVLATMLEMDAAVFQAVGNLLGKLNGWTLSFFKAIGGAIAKFIAYFVDALNKGNATFVQVLYNGILLSLQAIGKLAKLFFYEGQQMMAQMAAGAFQYLHTTFRNGLFNGIAQMMRDGAKMLRSGMTQENPGAGGAMEPSVGKIKKPEAPKLPPVAPPFKDEKKEKGDPLKDAQKAAIDAAKDEFNKLNELQDEQAAKLRLQLDKREIDEATYYTKSLALLNEYHTKYVIAQNKVDDAIDAATHLKQGERDNMKRDFDDKADKEATARWEKEQRTRLERDSFTKELDAAQRTAKLAALKAEDDLRIAEINRLEDAGVISHLAALDRINAIDAAEAARRLTEKQRELAEAVNNPLKQAALATEIAQIQADERAKEQARSTIRREARNKDLDEERRQAATLRQIGGEAQTIALDALRRRLELARGGDRRAEFELEKQIAQAELELAKSVADDKIARLEEERQAFLRLKQTRLDAAAEILADESQDIADINAKIEVIDRLIAKQQELVGAQKAANEGELDAAQRAANLAANSGGFFGELRTVLGDGGFTTIATALEKALGSISSAATNSQKAMVALGAISKGVFDTITKNALTTGKITTQSFKDMAAAGIQAAFGYLAGFFKTKAMEHGALAISDFSKAASFYAELNFPLGAAKTASGLKHVGLAALWGAGALGVSAIGGSIASAVRGSGDQAATNNAQAKVTNEQVAANTDPKVLDRDVNVNLKIETRTEPGILTKFTAQAVSLNGQFRNLVSGVAGDGPIATY